jgi:uncharacterized membrane protein YeaQ/YmgE (transglycosylase-associated protein family)
MSRAFRVIFAGRALRGAVCGALMAGVLGAFAGYWFGYSWPEWQPTALVGMALIEAVLGAIFLGFLAKNAKP